MNSLGKMNFTATCYLAGSWGSKPLGERECSVELFDFGKNSAQIEFIAGDDVEHIGLYYDNNKRILDFDGVFELPEQALELLKQHGFDVTHIE